MPIHNSYNIRTTPLAEPQDQKGDAGETQWLVWKQLPSKDLTARRRGVTSFWHTAAGNPSLQVTIQRGFPLAGTNPTTTASAKSSSVATNGSKKIYFLLKMRCAHRKTMHKRAGGTFALHQSQVPGVRRASSAPRLLDQNLCLA